MQRLGLCFCASSGSRGGMLGTLRQLKHICEKGVVSTKRTMKRERGREEERKRGREQILSLRSLRQS